MILMSQNGKVLMPLYHSFVNVSYGPLTGCPDDENGWSVNGCSMDDMLSSDGYIRMGAYASEEEAVEAVATIARAAEKGSPLCRMPEFGFSQRKGGEG